MKKVTTIAAKKREEIKGRPLKPRLRVCAYCRVSSNSRFARNTADCLDAVRFLKSLGVAVFFERENIRWSLKKRFRRGKVTVTTKRFLGYDTGENGELVVNPVEAEIVKRIFKEYIAGKSIREIKNGLEDEGIKTVTGLDKWPKGTIRGVLTNEKYYGDAVLQKTYTADYLTHKKKRNRGEVPLYYVKGNHEPIISKEEFDLLQRLMAERAAKYGNLSENREKYARRYVFSGRTVCGNCGATFRRRTWNSKAPSKQIVWQCSTYVKRGKAACSMKALDDITLKNVFLRAFNRLYINKEAILKPFMENVEKVLLSGLKSEPVKDIDVKIEETTEQLKRLIRLQIKENIEPDVFQSEYGKLKSELDELKEERNSIGWDESRREEMLRRTGEIYNYLDEQDGILSEFEDDVFDALVEHISRFARNTLDCLKYVRLLKEKGIAVYFEKENIIG